MNRRVLHVIDTMGVGGAEMLVVTLLNNLQGYELHLIALKKPDTLAREVSKRCKIKFLNFTSFRSIPRCALELRKYIIENKIDIVHSHLYWSNIIARLATPRNVTVFNCLQNISSKSNYTVNRLSLYLEKLTYCKRHHIIAVSRSVLDDFNAWVGIKGRATVLYNVIHDKYFANLPRKYNEKKTKRLVSVGNLKNQKNYQYVIEVFKQLPKNFYLDIYGVGPLHQSLSDQIEQYQLNINLCGLTRDIDKKLINYDAYLMCSLYEGFSLGLMEALAIGLPSFLSDIPVQRESAMNAAVYFDLNDPADCVNKIIATFDNPGKLNEMSAKGIDVSAKLAKKDNYLKKLVQLYETRQE